MSKQRPHEHPMHCGTDPRESMTEMDRVRHGRRGTIVILAL
jgi:hypothetical protein